MTTELSGKLLRMAKAKVQHRAKPSYKALGAAIKQLREEQGLLQAEVAEKTGLHASYVSDIERGKRNPTWTVLSQFAKAFGIKLSELVQRAEQQGQEMVGEENLAGYSREQVEAARRDPRLERGRGAMVADFGGAIEEVERTRMMSILGLLELRNAYEREQADFDANGGDQQREHEVQVSWQRAELARAEIESGNPALNAQALVSMNSALDALVQEFAPAVRDLPFQATMKQAEEEVPEAVECLTPEVREKMLEELRGLLKVPEELKPMKGSGVSRYERCLKQVGLGASEDRPIPADLKQALKEFGAIRDVLVHRAGRFDEKALKQAPSLKCSYKDGELVRLSDENYRTYSAALRCYGAEVIHRLWRKWPDLISQEEEVDLQNWREQHIAGA